MRFFQSCVSASVLCLAAFGGLTQANANPQTFSYTYESAAPGDTEFNGSILSLGYDGQLEGFSAPNVPFFYPDVTSATVTIVDSGSPGGPFPGTYVTGHGGPVIPLFGAGGIGLFNVVRSELFSVTPDGFSGSVQATYSNGSPGYAYNIGIGEGVLYPLTLFYVASYTLTGDGTGIGSIDLSDPVNTNGSWIPSAGNFASVPDTSSTVVLMALGVGAVLSFRRRIAV